MIINIYIYTYVYIDVCVYMQIRDDCWIPFRFWGSRVQDERLLKGLSLFFHCADRIIQSLFLGRCSCSFVLGSSQSSSRPLQL